MIVMEYCAGGSLMDIMKVRQRTCDEEQIAAAMFHTLKALRYLHHNKILHRDVKVMQVVN